MAYLLSPLIQGAVLWSLYLLNNFFGNKPGLEAFPYRTDPVTIHNLYNNVATNDFDGQGGHYPIELLPTGVFMSENVNFSLPNWSKGYPDNIISDGQVIEVVANTIREFHLLYAGDWIDGETGEKFLFEFKDGSIQSVECSVKNWWNLHWLNFGPIQLPYHRTSQGIDYNITQIHHWSSTVNSHSPLKKIHLPAASSLNRLHIFAISLVPAYTVSASDHSLGGLDVTFKGKTHHKAALGIKRLEWTTRSVEWGDHKGDSIVEVTIANLAVATRDARYYEGFLDAPYTIHVSGDGVSTTVPGRIRRLMPGDDARVDIGVGIEPRLSDMIYRVNVQLYDASNHLAMESEEWELRVLPASYEATKESLDTHETPRWWREAKFGIFIHWGIYSVPGWVPTGFYEEWYHWWIHYPAGPSNVLWNYHRETYGEDVVYDDFIANFTGAKFDANEWIDLFANAGAKYFVLVTKHHDGFALFDTEDSTHRSSVHLGPHRDFLEELMIASKEKHPDMKRGTYYSMPEWFNPAFAQYGFGIWPGGLARNPYDPSKMEPHTGHLDGRDYLKDIQEAHMKILAEKYNTDIMWCDIGGPNRTPEFAAKWYNDARKAGKQVTMNNRCGIAPDFDTPEYARFSSIQTRSWETNESIDPYSYGYNRQTKDEDYRSTKYIIHSLVDIVSKNGNYLLNLGPTGEGEIIPAMVERLVEVGKWLSHSGSCIYNTTYSFPGAEEGHLRFTTTTDTFCIIALELPETLIIDHDGELVPYAMLTVHRPVPVLQHDKVFLLGGSGEALNVQWREGKLVIIVPIDELNLVKHAWAFQVQYA